MHGSGKIQTDEEQDAVRTKMEAQMSAEKNRREAGSTPPTADKP
jgi:hypothetical protein